MAVLVWGESLFAGVNLIQDTKGIECRRVGEGSEAFDRLEIDAKDANLKLTKAGKFVAEYEQIKFLDSAVLMKRKGGGRGEARGGEKEVVLFQIQRNGDHILLRGGLFPFEEKNCDDVGAAKLCKAARIDRLSWNSEKIEFKSKKQAFSGPVSQYGVFTSRATYFLAESDSASSAPASLALIDYGAKVDLVFGSLTKLNCVYVEDQ